MTESRPDQPLAPVEPTPPSPTSTPRRPDPTPFRSAWLTAGVAAGSSLAALIVGPMAAVELSPTGELTADGAPVPAPEYVYLRPGEQAPDGATVMRLDPITVIGSPDPGAAIIITPPRETVVVHLAPGQTPPPGAIVREEGRVPPAATTPPASSAPPPADPPAATPRPTPRPTPQPTPPPTRQSGG